MSAPVELSRAAGTPEALEPLVARCGGRVGVAAVLADLNRQGRRSAVPGAAVGWGFRWNAGDDRTYVWWPQGVTVAPEQAVAEREVLCVSWYAKEVGGVRKGVRLSLVDLTVRERPRYRHVLLVEPLLDGAGRPAFRPVRAHAGGLAWHGRTLHVAGTLSGLRVCRPEDVVRVPRDLREAAFGYRYLLPVAAEARGAGAARLRCSFVAVGTAAGRPVLCAGEYGRGEVPRRLATFPLDPTTGELEYDGSGRARPHSLTATAVDGMQGAVLLDGTWHVTSSAGRFALGNLWVGEAEHLSRRTGVLPIGPEDLAFDPRSGRLWSLTEYPRSRFVFTVGR